MTTLVGFAAPTYGNDVSESAGSLTHTLTLSAPSSQAVTVTVRGSDSISPGVAGSADLGVADQIITFAPGQTTASFTTPILEDSLYEGNELYQFTIISATGAEIDLTNTNARYLTGNILDNDQPTSPLVGFAAPTYGNDVSESAGSLTHTLTLSAPSSQTVTVTVRGSDSISPGVAGSADLGVADQIITFAPGQTTASFTTPILEDSHYEGNELYQFTIISATGAEIDLTNTNARYLTGNILDNDQPTNPLVGFAAPTYGNDVSESAGSLTHTLTLSAPSSQTVTVTVRGSNSISPGVAGSADLGVADQIITFAPGQTTASFTTPILEDSLYEGNELYQFTIISATGAEIDLTNTNARYLTGNILDNDSSTTPDPKLPLTVCFAAPTYSDVSESAGSLTKTLTLSAPSSQTVTVTVRGQNGTGIGSAGSADLGVTDQVITFAPGQTTATFTTAVHEDSLYEGNESYYFEIVSATGAEIDLTSGGRQLWGSILDNDQPANPLVGFAAPTYSDVSESAGSLTKTLTLSAPSSQTVTVTVRGQNGTGIGSAGSADLGVTDQVITFAPGQTTATFTTAVHEDSLYEGNESYYFEIVSATGAEIDLTSGGRQLWGSILDNDQPANPLVGFAAPTYSDVSESAGSLTKTLTLSAPSSQTVTVTVRGQNGTGIGSAGSADLGVTDQVITFAPGQTTATFTTAVHEDSLYEGNESYYFEIVSATGAEIDLTSGGRQLWGSILDNDQPGANNAPIITSNGGGSTAAVSLAENTTAVTTVTATDPDVGQTLSYSIIGGADANKFTIGSSTGVLSFVTAPDFELSTDAGGNNVYDVTVQASDGHGGIDTQTIAVTVTDVSENGAPGITSGNFSLTSGTDTVVGGAADDTVYATAATLNAGDSLTGGAGTDVLALIGSGSFSIDQLATFTGFERIKLDNATTSYASLTLGSQPIEVDATGFLSIQVNSPLNWNGSNIIKGDALQAAATSLSFSGNFNSPQTPTTYDLTSNTLSHIGSVTGLGNDITLLVNSTDTTNIQSFSAWGVNDRLVTAGSTLDLSHTMVAGFTVASTNGLGTTFTVGDLGTAFQIAGGSGQDTIIATGLTFSADQRNAIFAMASVEKIVDQSGTYVPPPPSPGVVGLTTGNDTIVTPSSGSTVSAIAATLNAGDSLTGGAGTDVLALIGSGSFSIDQLATFTGFERIKLDNATTSYASLTLGSQPIEVDATGFLSIQVNSPLNWNGSNIIKGDALQAAATSLSFSGNFNSPQTPTTYDLTSNTLSHIGSVTGLGNDITLLVNSTDTTNIQSFSAWGVNDRLVTAGSTLDLSHTMVAGFTVASTNGLGTTFTVGDLGTAFQIAGGSGQDTIIATGLTFSADQRNAIFAMASVEKIVDQSGTYVPPPPSPGVVGLTTGNDTIVTPSSGSTVSAIAATLNAGDSLTGGAGTDVLALIGSGSFSIDQLATFTGFERIKLDNATTSYASLTLGSQPIEVDATGFLSIQVNSPLNWNGSNIIKGDALQAAATSLSFSGNFNSPQTPTTYDLTSNTLSHIGSVTGLGNDITLLVNSTDTTNIQSFSAWGVNDRLVTAGSTLDLSHTMVAGFTVASTNGLGTTFTVGDLGTAFQIAGGSGQDTIIATGLTFSADQRNAIFAMASVEKIVDQTGTYMVDNAPPIITSNGGGSTAAVLLAENTTAITTVTATDPDVGQTLSYSIIGGADAGKFTIGSTTGALSFVAAPNFELPTDTGGNNVYDVIVQATDGQSGDTQAIAVTVTDINEGPAFSAIHEITLVNTEVGIGYNPSISADGRYVAFQGFVRDLQTGVFLGTGGLLPSISADGRYVAFQPSAGTGAFVQDLQTGATTLINSQANYPSISADGHHVAFYSNLGLVPGDTNNATDLFVQDLRTSNITRVSTNDAYVYWANVHAGISADGRYVAFLGGASDLMTGDPNGKYALFVRDLQTGDITRVSTFTGQAFLDGGLDPSISADGRYVAFANGVSGGVWDLQTGDVVSVLAAAYHPSISADGRYVAFSSGTTNLVPGDTNGHTDVFVRDLHTGATIRVSTGVNGNQGQDDSFDPSISADGRYVAFTSRANLVAGDSGHDDDVYVVPVNFAPTITSNGGGNAAAVSLAETTTAVTTVAATDPDVGQTLVYSISGGVDAARFTIGSTTGGLSFITAPNFELPTDVDGNNVYDVMVQASDGHGGIDTQAIAVTVTDVFENNAPIITSNGSGETAAVSRAENTTAVSTVAATDPDIGQTLVYSISGGVDAARFTIGSTTGGLSFITAPNFELPTDTDGNNVYDVVVQASDGHGGLDTQAIAVTVNDVAENTTVIEAQGATDLTQVADHYFLYNSLGSGPSLKYGGLDFTAGQFGAWAPIGAEKTATGYQVAWKDASTGQYTAWDTDNNGNYVSNVAGLTGHVSGTNYALKLLETSFQQDLNGDGQIGLVTTAVETQGSTDLTHADDHYFLYDSVGSGPSLKFGGADFVDGQFGAWAPIGAEKTATGYQVAWKDASTGLYTAWNTDNNGNYVSNIDGLTSYVSGTSYALKSLETTLHQDLNGDGQIGLVTTAIEMQGSTDLTHVADHYFHYDGGGLGPSLKFGGADFVDGQFGAWAPIGAEKTATGYQVAWKDAGTGLYTAWNTDNNGNYVSNIDGLTSYVSGTSYALKSLETTLHQDLNGDGQIGLVTTAIEMQGSTDLTHVADHYFLYDGGGLGPSLKFGGADFVDGQFGAWAPIGAEKTATGYQVAWKDAGTGLYTAWNTDNNGNYVSNIDGLTSYVSGTSTAMESLESSFHQDLNDDGAVGHFASVLDGHLGGQTLTSSGVGPTALIGGPNDILNAGAGADTFVFQPGFGSNTINGFAGGTDAIQFDHTIFADVADVQGHMQQIGSDVVIAHDPQNVVTLHDILLANLHKSGFYIV